MKTSAQQKFTQLLPTQNQVMSQGSSPVTGLPITRILLYQLDLNLVSLAHTLYTSCLLHRYQKLFNCGFQATTTSNPPYLSLTTDYCKCWLW